MSDGWGGIQGHTSHIEGSFLGGQCGKRGTEGSHTCSSERHFASPRSLLPPCTPCHERPDCTWNRRSERRPCTALVRLQSCVFFCVSVCVCASAPSGRGAAWSPPLSHPSESALASARRMVSTWHSMRGQLRSFTESRRVGGRMLYPSHMTGRHHVGLLPLSSSSLPRTVRENKGRDHKTSVRRGSLERGWSASIPEPREYANAEGTDAREMSQHVKKKEWRQGEIHLGIPDGTTRRAGTRGRGWRGPRATF